MTDPPKINRKLVVPLHLFGTVVLWMKSYNLNKHQKISTQPDMESRISVKTIDKHQFELTVYENPSSSQVPVILCLPAMGVSAKHYQKLGTEMMGADYIFAVADLRGLGSSSWRASRSTNFGYFDIVGHDIPAMIAELKKSYPARSLYLMGHSLGGQLATMFLGMHPQDVNGLILVACGSVHYRNWNFPQSLWILIGSQIAKFVSLFIGYFPGKRIGFAGTEAKTVIRDWSRLALTGRFEPKNSDFDFESSFRSVTAPVLGISLEGDWFAPWPALKNLCGKLIHSRPTFHHLSEPDTPKPTLNHFGWVHHSRPVVDKIKQWIDLLENR